MRCGVTPLNIAAGVATVTAGGAVPSLAEQARPCPGIPPQRHEPPLFRLLTFASVIINNLKALFSVDRATNEG